MIYILSLLPILLLVILSLARGVKVAVMVGWAVTTVLFFFWGAGGSQYLAAMGVSLLTTINILMIVLGAVFLYTIMSHTGMITDISHSLDGLHPSKEIRFFLLALGLTAFFEGVAGFGTPGAIVPLILMALGFGAVLSVSVVLLFDGMVALFVGVMGAFITGSTTISNVVFGASQLETAVSLEIAPATMLALQLTGASIGNAICLFNIIAAASVANIKDYRTILSNNMLPTLLAALLVGLLGMGLVSFGAV